MPDSVNLPTLAVASGHDLSVALLDGKTVLAERHVALERGHSERLMPELRALLAPFGGPSFRPARIIVEIGPGSFTGLRIGLAAARALGLAWQCPVMGVRSTLLVAAAAQAAGINGPAMIALAAPRGQIWLEAFDLPALKSLGAPQALLPEDAAHQIGRYPALAGTVCRPASTRPSDTLTDLAIAPMARSAALVPDWLLAAPVPLYIRPGEVRAAA